MGVRSGWSPPAATTARRWRAPGCCGSNRRPTRLDVCDLAALAGRAHAAGALVAVDNTTATVLAQRLALGADFSVSSDTKAMTGHADLVLATSRRATLTCCRPSLAGARRWAGWPGRWRPGWRTGRWPPRRPAAPPVRHGAGRRHGPPRPPRGARLPLPGAPRRPRARARGAADGAVRPRGGVHPGRPRARRAGWARCAWWSRRPASAASAAPRSDARAGAGDDVHPGFVRFSAGVEDPGDVLEDVTGALVRARGTGAAWTAPWRSTDPVTGMPDGVVPYQRVPSTCAPTSASWTSSRTRARGQSSGKNAVGSAARTQRSPSASSTTAV